MALAPEDLRGTARNPFANQPSMLRINNSFFLVYCTPFSDTSLQETMGTYGQKYRMYEKTCCYVRNGVLCRRIQ